MIVLTRKVPSKRDVRDFYGDRNAIILTMEDGSQITVTVRGTIRSKEIRVIIDGPDSMDVVRKELITGRRKSNED